MSILQDSIYLQCMHYVTVNFKDLTLKGFSIGNVWEFSKRYISPVAATTEALSL